MKNRGIVAIACVVYLVIAFGCMLTRAGSDAPLLGDWRTHARPPVESARGERLAALPMRGVAMQIQRVDFTTTEYRKSIDEIVAMGADAVLFVFDSHQENAGSTRIYLDMRLMPTPAQTGDLIDYARSRKLRVMLMPIILLDEPRTDREWRGTIQPDDWYKWWYSYRDLLRRFARVGEEHGADVLVIGSELVSTEKRTDEWVEAIAEVRGIFKGMLTYSANWDHYREVTFWDWLDFAAMNCYYTLGEDNKVTVPQIEANWVKYKDKLLDFQKDIKKPIFFTEVGWCSQSNAAKEPWDYTRQQPLDLDLQSRLWEGFFKTWHGVPQFGGFMVWEWPPGDGGPTDTFYTPEGKPAEKIIRQWLAREPWKAN
jgi:hypothetical protein